MGVIGRVIGLAVVGMAATMAASAVAAMSAKQRIVPTTDPADDEISLASIFGPLAYTSTSQHFTGGTIECWYGGGAVDLRGATLAPEGATLKVKAIFGGGQILVPSTWAVITKANGVGGLTDSRSGTDVPADAPTLTIEATVVFGGFQVVSEVAPEQEAWMAEQEAALEAAAASATDEADAIKAAVSMNGAEPEMTPAT
jgi:hypothetical protein